MRSFSIIVVLATMCSCVKAPYFRLDKPLYFEAEQSFWSGCEQDAKGDKACRESRIEQVYAGVKQWFDYFDKSVRPQVIFVSSKKQLPAHTVNHVIRLGISKTFCGKDVYGDGPAGACYGWKTIFSTITRIILRDASQIISDSIAHELGHAFGLDDNYAPAVYGSVMSYSMPTPVTSFDVKKVCELHRECQKMKHKRHKRNSLF